jgi:hypothetical protein
LGDGAARQRGDGGARGERAELPRIVSDHGRHALFVDGAPFLMLGAQGRTEEFRGQRYPGFSSLRSSSTISNW